MEGSSEGRIPTEGSTWKGPSTVVMKIEMDARWSGALDFIRALHKMQKIVLRTVPLLNATARPSVSDICLGNGGKFSNELKMACHGRGELVMGLFLADQAATLGLASLARVGISSLTPRRALLLGESVLYTQRRRHGWSSRVTLPIKVQRRSIFDYQVLWEGSSSKTAYLSLYNRTITR